MYASVQAGIFTGRMAGVLVWRENFLSLCQV